MDSRPRGGPPGLAGAVPRLWSMSENDPHAHGPLLSADAVERATALAATFAASTPTLPSPVASPEALDFLARAADDVLRPEGTSAPAAALHRLAGDAPAALPWMVRGAVQLGGAIAPVLPSPAVPLARRASRMRSRPCPSTRAPIGSDPRSPRSVPMPSPTCASRHRPSGASRPHATGSTASAPSPPATMSPGSPSRCARS